MRFGLTVVFAALVVLLGAVPGQANHGAQVLSISDTESGPGARVVFEISGTHSDDTYKLFVDDQEVKAGTDPAGDGVGGQGSQEEWFKMPDLGGSDKEVSIVAKITSGAGATTETNVHKMIFRAPAFSAGPTGPQPESVLVPQTPLAQPLPAARATPTGGRRRAGRTPTSRRRGSAHERAKKRSKARDNSSKRDRSPSGGSNPTSQGGGSNPVSQGGGGGTNPGLLATPGQKPPKTPRVPKAQKPSGPAGPPGLNAPTPPTSSPGSPASSTVATGAADIAGGGLPMAVIVLLSLLGLAALALAGAWTANNWHGWPRPPANGREAAEVRLGALSRAATAGADLQQTLAQRKASRTTGPRPLSTIEK